MVDLTDPEELKRMHEMMEYPSSMTISQYQIHLNATAEFINRIIETYLEEDEKAKGIVTRW